MTAMEILAVLRSHRFVFACERDLQQGVSDVLIIAGVSVKREVSLNARDRIDLMVGRTGIEVKITGAWRDVERQLCRYLESPLLDDLVLVTVKANHARIPQGEMMAPFGARKRLFVHQITTSGL